MYALCVIYTTAPQKKILPKKAEKGKYQISLQVGEQERKKCQCNYSPIFKSI